MPTPLLKVDGLAVQRDTQTLLHPLHWTVQKGQHWVILGPNGCGKTTLLRTLAGYLTATEGRMQVLGKTYGECDWRDLRNWLGLVTSTLQASIPLAEPALETVISGRYGQLDLWVKTTVEDERAGRRWLRFFGIGHLAHREWLYLSQGERQRVLIARALMARPRLLILDEPCTGLDPVARAFFLDAVERLSRRRGGPGLVLVTHHLEEIPPSFTHGLLLRAGSVAAQGPLREVLTNRLVSQTFGVPCRVSRRDDRWNLRIL